MCHWMDVNELKLNHNKTEIMLIHSKCHTSSLLSYFSMGNERLTTTATARSLGVVLDDMLFNMHVSDICRSLFNQLRNLSKIRKYLNQESSKIAVYAFITSKLNYCNSLLYMIEGKCSWRSFNMFRTLPPESLLRLVNLLTLHLFYLTFTGFLLVMLVFKSLNNLSASYLADRQLHSRNLWSTSKQLLEQRRSFTKLTGTRLFQCMP